MFRISKPGSRRAVIACVLLAITSAVALPVLADGHQTSGPFMGPKANKGTVTHTKEGSMNVLTLSEDFVVPDTPAPHWQVVDSNGNVFLLQRLLIKGDHYNQKIVVPAYIVDIARVQIWCAWAETLLGEASFAMPVK